MLMKSKENLCYYNNVKENSQFELTLAKLANSMGISSNELLLFAKNCRESDSITTSIEGFDELIQSIVEKDNV